MSHVDDNPYRSFGYDLASQATVDVRAQFIRKTYANLTAAIIGFGMLEAILLQMPGLDRVTTWAFQGWNWMLVLGGFFVVSYIAEKWANSAVSLTTQYMGLCLYVVAEAIIFVPLLYLAQLKDAAIIPNAAVATLAIFGGLTAVVFVTKKDFSFLRGILAAGVIAALGLIICSMIFGFSLGIVFTWAMIFLASGYILYHTSAVLHQYHIGQHVAAALALFASVALLFWYIVQLFLSRD